MQREITALKAQIASGMPPGLAEAQAKLAAIVESSDDGIVGKTLEGVVTSWNQGAERIFGYSAQEMLGTHINRIIPDDRQHEEPMILGKIRSGQRVDHFETIRRRKDGRFINVSVTISPIRDAMGKIIGASKIARDITQQKQIEAELKKAKDAAEEANRAKDQFLSVLSHELRTPLTPILAAMSYLEQQPNLPEELRSQLGMLRRNVETEARLVDDLLDLTRIAKGKIRLHYEVVDVHEAVRMAIGMVQPEIDAKRLEVSTALRATQHHVWADAGRLQQVFLNLLSNAVKFTPEEGVISVRTSTDEMNGKTRVEISDNGMGIEPDMLGRLFNSFEQSDRSRRLGGLGLGLAISKSLVEMHHGSIKAASGGPGKGATFTVEFRTIAASSMPASGAAKPLAPLEYPCRVLLVEDHLDTRKVMVRLLRSFGCSVIEASSVAEALAAGRREEFDLLLSDIGLPDGTGMQIMRELRTMKNIKGIAVSGFGQDEDLARSREAGFETHLIKPVNMQTLRETIMKVIAA